MGEGVVESLLYNTFAFESTAVHKFPVGVKSVHKRCGVTERFCVICLREHFYWWHFG